MRFSIDPTPIKITSLLFVATLAVLSACKNRKAITVKNYSEENGVCITVASTSLSMVEPQGVILSYAKEKVFFPGTSDVNIYVSALQSKVEGGNSQTICSIASDSIVYQLNLEQIHNNTIFVSEIISPNKN